MAGYSSLEDDQDFDDNSAGEDFDEKFKPKLKRQSATINGPANMKHVANTNSDLNHNIPVFVPRNSTKSGETYAAFHNVTSKPTSAQNQTVPIKSITTIKEMKMSDTMTQSSHKFLDVRSESHIYEEGEEEDILKQCRADASRKGDLSLMHSKTSKKSRERDRSWDDRIFEDLNIRRPPMRNAKQKQVTQAIITKANRSRNKA